MSEWVSETSTCTCAGPSGSVVAGHEIESEAAVFETRRRECRVFVVCTVAQTPKPRFRSRLSW